jgi:hypothetical protein
MYIPRALIGIFFVFFSNPLLAVDPQEKYGYQSAYEELASMPSEVLGFLLDEQIEALLTVNAAAPPDLSHKIAAIKSATLSAMRQQLCARAGSASPTENDKIGAASSSLVQAMSPKPISAINRGRIAALLIKIGESSSGNYCL